MALDRLRRQFNGVAVRGFFGRSGDQAGVALDCPAVESAPQEFTWTGQRRRRFRPATAPGREARRVLGQRHRSGGLVDDGLQFRTHRGKRQILEPCTQGFDIVGEARDGVEAIALAEQLMPDVILMDVSMPNCDGVEACRQVKARNNPAKVVMLTMHVDKEVLTNAIRAAHAADG